MNGISAPGKNRHPVDELADVRESQKQLKAREEKLKACISEMMGGSDHLGGDEWIASQKLIVRKGSVDAKAMEADGINPAKYRKPDSTAFSVVLQRRADEVA